MPNHVEYIEVYNPNNGIRIYYRGQQQLSDTVGGFRNTTIPFERHEWEVLDTAGDKIFTVRGTSIIPFFDRDLLERKLKAQLDDMQRLAMATSRQI